LSKVAIQEIYSEAETEVDSKINKYLNGLQNRDLVVDWVGFNLCGCDNYSSIASYLFELNFNIIEKLDHFTPATKILWDSNNSYKCVFIRTKIRIGTALN
jgi:hypothetical protein